MARRLFTLLSALSLLLCAAVVVLWVRAQWAGGYLEHMHVDPAGMRDRLGQVWLGRGSVVLHGSATRWAGDRSTLEFYVRTGRTGLRWQPLPPFSRQRATPTVWDALGFDFRMRTDGSPLFRRKWVTLALPYWLLTLLTALPPALRARRALRRRRRIRAGRCTRCGYDLRATPGRCPECGTTPVSAVKA